MLFLHLNEGVIVHETHQEEIPMSNPVVENRALSFVARGEFFVARLPVFWDGDFSIPPVHSPFSSLCDAVYIARRSGYVAIRSKWLKDQTLVVTESAWQRFEGGVREGQFDPELAADNIIEVGILDSEVAVRMVSEISNEVGVIPFSKNAWNAFVKGVQEGLVVGEVVI